MDHKNSQSASYAAAGVDIVAGYRAVELMKWRSLCWSPAPTAAAPR